MWRNWNAHANGNVNGSATVENSLLVSQKVKCRVYPVVPLVGIYPKEMKSAQTNTWACIFIAALFTIAKNGNKYSPMEEWMNKLWYTHTMGSYSNTKRRKF